MNQFTSRHKSIPIKVINLLNGDILRFNSLKIVCDSLVGRMKNPNKYLTYPQAIDKILINQISISCAYLNNQNKMLIEVLSKKHT